MNVRTPCLNRTSYPPITEADDPSQDGKNHAQRHTTQGNTNPTFETLWLFQQTLSYFAERCSKARQLHQKPFNCDTQTGLNLEFTAMRQHRYAQTSLRPNIVTPKHCYAKTISQLHRRLSNIRRSIINQTKMFRIK